MTPIENVILFDWQKYAFRYKTSFIFRGQRYMYLAYKNTIISI